MIPQAILATAIALLPLAGGTPAPTHYSPMPASGVVAVVPDLDGDGVVTEWEPGWEYRPDYAPDPSAPIQEDDPRWNCASMGNRVCG